MVNDTLGYAVVGAVFGPAIVLAALIVADLLGGTALDDSWSFIDAIGLAVGCGVLSGAIRWFSKSDSGKHKP